MVPKETRFYNLFDRASSLFREEDFKGASIAAREAIEIERPMRLGTIPLFSLAGVYRLLAAALYKIGDKDALISAKKAIETGIYFAQSTGDKELQLEFLHLQAKILQAISATEELRLTYKDILKLEGRDLSALMGLMNIDGGKEFVEDFNLFETLIQLDPNYLSWLNSFLNSTLIDRTPGVLLDFVNIIDTQRPECYSEMPVLLFYRCYAKYKSGSVQVARSDMEKLLNTHADDAQFILLYAEILIIQKDFESADKILRQIQEEDRRDRRRYYLDVLMLVKMGLGEWKEALSAVDERLEYSRDVSTLKLKAAILKRSCRLKEAKNIYEELFDRAPSLLSGLKLATFYLEINEYEESVEIVLKVWQGTPRNAAIELFPELARERGTVNIGEEEKSALASYFGTLISLSNFAQLDWQALPDRKSELTWMRRVEKVYIVIRKLESVLSDFRVQKVLEDKVKSMVFLGNVYSLLKFLKLTFGKAGFGRSTIYFLERLIEYLEGNVEALSALSYEEAKEIRAKSGKIW